MVRAGVWLNIIGIILVTLTVYTLASWVLGFSFG
jgi:sodium-dependent dicarboxylate transporter 2/3/5